MWIRLHRDNFLFTSNFMLISGYSSHIQFPIHQVLCLLVWTNFPIVTCLGVVLYIFHYYWSMLFFSAAYSPCMPLPCISLTYRDLCTAYGSIFRLNGGNPTRELPGLMTFVTLWAPDSAPPLLPPITDTWEQAVVRKMSVAHVSVLLVHMFEC